MKKHSRSVKILSLGMALIMTLCLTACKAGDAPAETVPPTDSTSADGENTEPNQPERSVSDTMLLGGNETTVFLDVSDEEIEFWDSASGGQLLAVAKYPEAIPGAADALESCDFTDLDSDGNSDLTASFRFADGTSANLLWFFSDGGFVYNEEFSQLPGEASNGE